MATEVQISSNALQMLGAKAINSFTEENEFAGLAGNLWESVRDDILRTHPWNCCIKRVNLSPMVGTPAFGFGYQFTLPADCIRVMSVGDNSFVNYRLEGRKILMDDSVCNLRYVFKNTDASSYDTGLTMLLQMAMASRMAYAVTKSSAVATAMETQYQIYAKRARAVDGQEDITEDSMDSNLIGARASG